MAAKLKKGRPRVVVLAGRDKGKTGEIVKVIPAEGRALVRGVNQVKRHQRQTASQEAGIITKEAPLQISNLAYARSEGRQADSGWFQGFGRRAQGSFRQAFGRSDRWLRHL